MFEHLADDPVALFLTLMGVILIAPLLSERVRLPGIIGLILGGMLVGPYALGLISAGRTVEVLSTVGLIYLMFSAGLEINLQQFRRVRNRALLFGLLTFAIPQLAGTLFGRAIGLTWPGAILLGSAFASHTLLAFPILTRLGIVTNEAVSVTIGATVFTDVAAFLVLAIIAGTGDGELSTGYLGGLAVSILLYAGLVLFGLPRLGKLFFRFFGGRAVEFQFVLVALFVAAFLAEVVGMHGVVGAFLAGLAINSTLSHNSAVVGRVLFLGEAFFIPVFLMHSGMITDPRAFVSSADSLLLGVGITLLAYLTKLLAAWAIGRLYRYTRDETMTAWGLSQAQAAVTLPTILIGLELGLFTEEIFNGVILMILATSVTSPMFVQRFGRRLGAPATAIARDSLFDRILVSVANPDTERHLITLASILARAENGQLIPLNVVRQVNGQVEGLEQQRRLMSAEVISEAGPDVQPVWRVDTSIAEGILHAALEKEATLIVMGWRGKPTFRQSIFGTVLDQVIWRASAPVLVGRMTLAINAIERVVLVAPPNSLHYELVGRTLQMVSEIAGAINVPIEILSARRYIPDLEAELTRLGSDIPYEITPLGDDLIGEAARPVRADDLLIVTTMGSRLRFRSSLGHIPERLAELTHCSLIVIHYPSSEEASVQAASAAAPVSVPDLPSMPPEPPPSPPG